MENSHVIYFEEAGGVKPSKIADTLIGLLLILVVITGIVGNIPAVVYFWRRRKNTLPDLLYTVISITDIFTSTVTILKIPPLFNNRRPGVLESYELCAALAFHFNHLQRFSMYMVIMISITRTIAIFTPFYVIKRKNVILACIAFEMVWIAIDVGFVASGSLQTVYYAPAIGCGVIPGKDADIKTWNIYIVLNLFWIVLGSFVVFISFILSLRTVALRKRSAFKSANERKFVDVSVTISLFTAVFLLCNLPILCLQLYVNFIYFLDAKDYLADSGGYSWYGLVIAHVFLTTFNAATNPCLYLTRMAKYRAWLRGKLPGKLGMVSSRVADSTVQSQGQMPERTQVSGVEMSNSNCWT